MISTYMLKYTYRLLFLQMKKISCGTLITRERKGRRELFMGHVTGYKFWDIPKGGMNLGENYIETAIRELREEAGFICDQSELFDLGMHDYTVRKDLYLFKYIGNQTFCHKKAFCESHFFHKSFNRMMPEMDNFKYVDYADVFEHCTEGFKTVFPRLIANGMI